jgi:TATA-binding protein-associated factor Taf7
MNTRRTEGGTEDGGAEDGEILDVEIIEDESSERDGDRTPRGEERAGELSPLFTPETAEEYRSRWDLIQRDFVDDPERAIRQGDELVSELISGLARTFIDERRTLEDRLNQKDHALTETLRLAMRRHRSLLERLLAF